jgi:hypothetical protein
MISGWQYKNKMYNISYRKFREELPIKGLQNKPHYDNRVRRTE